MTEIPEHLLKRSKERRAAMGGGEAAPAGDAPAAAPAAGGDAPAAAAPAAAPAPKAPAPLPTLEAEQAEAKPDSPVVAAAKRRKRVPVYGAAVLAFLPIWAFIYFFAVSEPPAGDSDPLVIGSGVYGSAGCAGCHGGGGEGGGAGQQLNDGAVIETFSDPLAMVHWIAYGADGGARDDGTYGDLDREGGPRTLSDHPGKMSAFSGSLTPEELAAVTIYIRQEIAGGDPAEDPNFNAETFAADPGALAEAAQAVIDLGEGGDPDLSTVELAEAEAAE